MNYVSHRIYPWLSSETLDRRQGGSACNSHFQTNAWMDHSCWNDLAMILNVPSQNHLLACLRILSWFGVEVTLIIHMDISKEEVLAL